MESAAKVTKKRTPNFTPIEKRRLADLVYQFRDIIEDKHTDSVTNSKKQKSWIEIAEEFNKQPSECYRSPESLRMCWDNIKRLLKKEGANRRSLWAERALPPPTSPNDIYKGVVESVFNRTSIDSSENTSNNVVDAADHYLHTVKTDLDLPMSPLPDTSEQDLNLDWVQWTPALEREGLKRKSSTHLEEELLRKKIEQVDSEIRNANEEAGMKLLILDEKLKQERLKTKKLEESL